MYVGKAIRLRARVRSYFESKHEDRPHIIPMIPLIDDIEFIGTENEVEALILEANLIKKYLPKFNIDLKDNKTYAYIYVTTHEKFPRVLKTRELKKSSKGRYFGPYPDGRPVNRTLRFLRKLYPYCNEKEKNGKRACFYYHIGECPGPCGGKVTEEEYRESINKIIAFLEGRKVSVIKDLEEKMLDYSERELFEKAGELRDKIYDLKYLGQKITIDQGDTEVEMNMIKKRRNAKAVQSLFKRMKAVMPGSKLFLENNYNAKIECYDISNIQGTNPVGSMTVAVGGDLKKDLYRHFVIKTLEERPNDVGMMREMLDRRLKYLNAGKDVDESFSIAPDLIFVDGGKTQLGMAYKLLLEYGLTEKIPVAGIAKKFEIIWYVDKTDSKGNLYYRHINIGKSKPELQLVQRLRDEAHRFAITHHRLRRLRAQKRTVLDLIEGIGAKRKKALLKHFGGLQNLKVATFEEIDTLIKNKTVTAEIVKTIKEA